MIDQQPEWKKRVEGKILNLKLANNLSTIWNIHFLSELRTLHLRYMDKTIHTLSNFKAKCLCIYQQILR